MKTDQMGWLGMKVGDFVLREELGTGAFSYTYLAEHTDGHSVVIKFAQTVPPETPMPHDTRALMFATGSMVDVAPDVVALLKAQFKLLQKNPNPAFPTVGALHESHGYHFYDMEYIEGATLKEAFGGASQKELLQWCGGICGAMESLNVKHGDLKPANVIVAPEGKIRVIDPGYFGKMRTQYGEVDPCIVTTPAYYPFVRQDDLLAMGLMMWEMFTGRHPLVDRRPTEQIDRSTVTDELYKWVRHEELVGRYFASALISVPVPKHELKDLLMKAVHIKLRPDGVRDYDSGFESWTALRKAIEAQRIS